MQEIFCSTFFVAQSATRLMVLLSLWNTGWKLQVEAWFTVKMLYIWRLGEINKAGWAWRTEITQSDFLAVCKASSAIFWPIATQVWSLRGSYDVIWRHWQSVFFLLTACLWFPAWTPPTFYVFTPETKISKAASGNCIRSAKFTAAKGLEQKNFCS